jgi:hypothetical protein
METIWSSETPVVFQQATLRYIFITTAETISNLTGLIVRLSIYWYFEIDIRYRVTDIRYPIFKICRRTECAFLCLYSADALSTYKSQNIVTEIKIGSLECLGARHQNWRYPYTKNNIQHKTGRQTLSWKTQVEMIRWRRGWHKNSRYKEMETKSSRDKRIDDSYKRDQG